MFSTNAALAAIGAVVLLAGLSAILSVVLGPPYPWPSKHNGRRQ